VQTIRSRAPHTDGEAATVIALVFGAGAAVLAVEEHAMRVREAA
jgi:hypothetical protein